MASDLTTQEIIDSVLRLPLADQERIFHVLQRNLMGEMVDHGSEKPASDAEAAWGDEIARRVADIDSGRVKTIPSDEAWKMIDGQAPPPTL